jgi:hypothetical protein
MSNPFMNGLRRAATQRDKFGVRSPGEENSFASRTGAVVF